MVASGNVTPPGRPGATPATASRHAIVEWTSRDRHRLHAHRIPDRLIRTGLSAHSRGAHERPPDHGAGRPLLSPSREGLLTRPGTSAAVVCSALGLRGCRSRTRPSDYR